MLEVIVELVKIIKSLF